jgi:hypothetical protein
MKEHAPPCEEPGPACHHRWARTVESDAFFIDEDRLRSRFRALAAGGAFLVAALAAGLWRIEREALSPPVFVGISQGLVFSGRPGGLEGVRDGDFDGQLADTVEVLLGRTERGLPPEIADFCDPGVVAAVAQAYGGSASRYPAGYAQTFAVLEARTLASRPGLRRTAYRGLLSSRSVSAAQTSPIYLDCTFVIGATTRLNATGWRLVRADAISRDDFYRDETEKARRLRLELPPRP